MATMPMTGTRVPRNHNQPTARYGANRRAAITAIVIAISTTNGTIADASETRVNGYGRAISIGTISLTRYAAYAISALAIRSTIGSDIVECTALRLLWPMNATTTPAMVSPNNGHFSAARRRRSSRVR